MRNQDFSNLWLKYTKFAELNKGNLSKIKDFAGIMKVPKLARFGSFYPLNTLPPLTFSTSPTTCSESPDAKKTIDPAISSAEPIFPRGIDPRISRFSFFERMTCATMSVRTHPGATQL